MHNDDGQKGGMYGHARQNRNHLFADKNQNYSPSMSYNYNPAGQMGMGHGSMQHPHRRTDRFKRELITLQERIVRQNNIIIKLLKELNYRLAPLQSSGGKPVDIPADTPDTCNEPVSENPGGKSGDYEYEKDDAFEDDQDDGR
jgi:hypothetical protein